MLKMYSLKENIFMNSISSVTNRALLFLAIILVEDFSLYSTRCTINKDKIKATTMKIVILINLPIWKILSTVLLCGSKGCK